MSVDVGIWGRLSRLVVVLLLFAGMLGVALWYYPLIKRNERMRQEVLRLDGQVQSEETNARQLKAGMDALTKDPKTVERLTREKLGYARTGETVIRFEDSPTNRPAPP